MRHLTADPRVTRIITFDPHSPQIQSFARDGVECHVLYGGLVRGQYIAEKYADLLHKLLLVTPDQGRYKATKKQLAPFIRKNPRLPIISLDKDRGKNGITLESDFERIFEDIPRDYLIIVDDDMVGTGSTNVQTIEEIRALGFNRVIGSVTHHFLQS